MSEGTAILLYKSMATKCVTGEIWVCIKKGECLRKHQHMPSVKELKRWSAGGMIRKVCGDFVECKRLMQHMWSAVGVIRKVCGDFC